MLWGERTAGSRVARSEEEKEVAHLPEHLSGLIAA